MKRVETNVDYQSDSLFTLDFDFDNVVIEIDASVLLNKIELLKKIGDLRQLRNEIQNMQEFIVDYVASQQEILLSTQPEQTIEVDVKALNSNLEQISQSQTLDRASYYIKRLIKSYTEVKTSKYNDINLNRWKEYEEIYTDSLWILDKRENSGVHNAGYWGNFIPQIPHQLMTRYTKKGEWVLDTFAGSGTTLIEAQRLGRNCIGFELQPKVIEQAEKNVLSEPNEHSTISKIFEGDSTDIDYGNSLKLAGTDSVQMVIMHPPYFDIIKFSEDERDLSNANDLDVFLNQMDRITTKAKEVLDKGRFLALVIGDKYDKGEWIPLGFLTMERIRSNGFTLKSIIVKNFEDTTGKRNQKELWRYRALVGGFYIFKHEYIFILQKD